MLKLSNLGEGLFPAKLTCFLPVLLLEIPDTLRLQYL